MVRIKVAKLHDDAILPTKGSEGAAGFDLYAVEGFRFKTHLNQRHLFPTGIAVEIPKGYYGRIAPRSGLAFKAGLDVMAGVIDSDYRGEVGVLLINTTILPVTIKPGDRIAQLIIEKYADKAEIAWDEKLAESIRGDGGFGSTGN